MTTHNPNHITHPAAPPRKGSAGRHIKRMTRALRPAPVVAKPPLGRVLAEAAMLVFWCAFWALNGWATIAAAQALGAWANRTFDGRISPLEWALIGGVGHIIISLIEGHLWRPMKAPTVDPDNPPTARERALAVWNGDRVRLGFAVVIGSLDSLSSAYYLREAAVLVAPGWHIFPLTGICAILATAIAIGAEPLIRVFGGGLVRLYRE